MLNRIILLLPFLAIPLIVSLTFSYAQEEHSESITGISNQSMLKLSQLERLMEGESTIFGNNSTDNHTNKLEINTTEESRINQSWNDTSESIDNNIDDVSSSIKASESVTESNDSLWMYYSNSRHGFNITYPSNWLVEENYNHISGPYPADFVYSISTPIYPSIKALTRISAIDSLTNYDDTNYKRILYDRVTFPNQLIDNEKIGMYTYIEKDNDKFFPDKFVYDILTIHNGKLYKFSFKGVSLDIKNQMLNSIRWLN